MIGEKSQTTTELSSNHPKYKMEGFFLMTKVVKRRSKIRWDNLGFRIQAKNKTLKSISSKMTAAFICSAIREITHEFCPWNGFELHNDLSLFF